MKRAAVVQVVCVFCSVNIACSTKTQVRLSKAGRQHCFCKFGSRYPCNLSGHGAKNDLSRNTM